MVLASSRRIDVLASLGSRRSLTSIKVFRYNPADSKPARFDTFTFPANECGPMVLDALLKVKNEMDPSLAFRRSCREGICGSCAMNMNGKNGLACITPLAQNSEVTIRPLPQTFVLRDLIPDLTNFYQHYEASKPWLQAENTPDENGNITEHIQSPADRKKLDDQYECILCACCTTSCPSQWWNPETFLGPQALLSAHRWITDSRDEKTNERLAALNDTMKLYRCHNIQNCTDACPKGLKPARKIENLKKMIESRVPIPEG